MVLAMAFFSCQQEECNDVRGGMLHFAISPDATTKATRLAPSELAKPIAEQFHLHIQRHGSSFATYEGGFVNNLEVKVGSYTITATYGENVLLGRDTPYYIGTATAEVKENEVTNVSIPCRVGNALVSVRFGRDADEQERFARFYSDYGLLVELGDYSLAIGKDETTTSIYFPAGSSPKLVFYGVLKNDGDRIVTKELSHADLPTTFQAADHAIVTLSLPDPQSAAVIQIGMVELVEARLDETIPISWLPVPQATAEHCYNAQGILLGTNVTFTNTYPEMTWEARVTNSQGEIVRTIVGEGELVANYEDDAEWPFLPAGKYKATYYLHSEGTVSKLSSREFIVSSPRLEAVVDGYTSYNKYLESNIAQANDCDGFTLYSPSVSVNLSPQLIGMEKYAYTMTYTFDGETQQAIGNVQNLGQKKLDARLQTYDLSVQVTFAGEEVSAAKSFRITGVPFSFEPPTTTTWEASGDVTDEGDYARFGRWHGGSQSLTYNKVALPAGLRLALDYKFVPNAGAVSTTFSISAGDQTLISGKAGSYQQPTYEGVELVTMVSDATYMKCYNSYGAGNTGTDLYRVELRYRE